MRRKHHSKYLWDLGFFKLFPRYCGVPQCVPNFTPDCFSHKRNRLYFEPDHFGKDKSNSSTEQTNCSSRVWRGSLLKADGYHRRMNSLILCVVNKVHMGIMATPNYRVGGVNVSRYLTNPHVVCD